MRYFLNRLREPSSLSAMVALAVLFGAPMDAANVVVQAVGGILGAAAILIPDGQK